MPTQRPQTRRTFLTHTTLGALTAAILPASAPAQTPATQPSTAPPTPPKRTPILRWTPPYDRATINLIGPRVGYTPQIGTLVTMLTWMESSILRPTRDLKQPDLDHLLDKNANTIGALLLHLAATEVLYQRNTFDNVSNKALDTDPVFAPKWTVPMDLGEAARATIKGHDLTYYIDALRAAREHTLAEFAKRDDAWLLTVDNDWPWGPTNNYCKWFHVCEHISHHAGQIDLILKRLPGAANGRDAG